jgi:hypothetical protein
VEVELGCGYAFDSLSFAVESYFQHVIWQSLIRLYYMGVEKEKRGQDTSSAWIHGHHRKLKLPFNRGLLHISDNNITHSALIVLQSTQSKVIKVVI